MSSPIHQSDDLDPALRYAPRWVRDRAALVGRPPPRTARPAQRAKPDFSGDRAMVELQRQLMLNPDAIPEPAVDDARSLKPIVLRLAGVMGLAALIAWGVVSFPSVKKAGEIIADDVKTPALTDDSVKLVLPQAVEAAPRPNPAQAVMNDPMPSRRREAASGSAAPPAADPSNTLVAAPAPAPEVVQPLKESPPAPMPLPPQAAPFVSPAATTAPADAAVPRSDDVEITAMIKRGKDLLMSGDIVSARLLLRRAADAGNAEAALALGATFDPLVIRRLGAVGMRPDIVQAKQWYQRAAELGSASAESQLAKLEQSQ
jgi:hypothetical protein